METGLYTIIEFDENDKWFVIGETIYNDEKYNYLIKLTPDENDFIEDYKTVKCFEKDNQEYFEIVKDKEVLRNIMPQLVPELEELLRNPKEALKELIKY